MANKELERKVAVVTGSSTGIGYETSLFLSRNGFYTYATMRNLYKSKRLNDIASKDNLPLKVLELDVTDDKSVKNAINQIQEEKKRIDVLVNNAGYDVFGAVEDLSTDEFKAQYETNVFGIIKVTKEVIPIMRNQRSGTIVNISSAGGRVGIPLNAAYVSSKFAVEGLSETMRYELQEYGINVIIIEPGVIKSNFFENSKAAYNATNTESPYSQLMQKVSDGFKPMLENGSSSPSKVADVILNAIKSNDPQVRYLVGDDAVSLIEKRNKMSDKEFESWMKESLLQQKGFIR
jgi:NAD(P)-dependent dehydrogenase (short-subunit alcohol dehydrogenase family)